MKKLIEGVRNGVIGQINKKQQEENKTHPRVFRYKRCDSQRDLDRTEENNLDYEAAPTNLWLEAARSFQVGSHGQHDGIGLK